MVKGYNKDNFGVTGKYWVSCAILWWLTIKLTSITLLLPPNFICFVYWHFSQMNWLFRFPSDIRVILIPNKSY